MKWFKNLNAMPRLMLSFGILIALIVGMSYLAISNLHKANDRVQALYQVQLQGIVDFEDISSAKNEVAQKDRDALIKMDDPAVVSIDFAAVTKDFKIMYADLKDAESVFTTDEEKAILTDMQQTLPQYEKGVHDITNAIAAKDDAQSKTSLYALAPNAAKMAQIIDRGVKLKKKSAEQAYVNNDNAYRSTRSLLIATCALSALIGLGLSIVVARGFSLPLSNAVEALKKVAGGDLTISLEVESRDEVGQMASALNTAVERLAETLQEVADNAANASSSSQQLAAASEAIASGAQEQAASLEETSASLEQITSTVRQSADNAQQASQLAAGSKDSALQGQQVVFKAVTAMKEINASSAEISDIISTIDEIAFQTNLLAVNAAVEAARAGDDGRGFAVVATEVRTLAQRSAVAAKEIKGLIQDSLRKVDAGSALVDGSGETLSGIVGSVKRVTDIVGEIAAASAEQSTGIEQVNKAMMQMDQVTQSNSAQTEELSATAASLADQATHLLSLVNTFTLSTKQSGANGLSSRNTTQHKGFRETHAEARSSDHSDRGASSRRATEPRKTVSVARAESKPRNLQTAFTSAAANSDASFEEF